MTTPRKPKPARCDARHPQSGDRCDRALGHGDRHSANHSLLFWRDVPTQITAAGLPSDLDARASRAVTASVSGRTIDGTVCEYGAIGFTSAGPTIFERASLAFPTPVSKVKLLVQHDTYSAAVGLMASFDDDKTLPRGRFTVPKDNNAEGDTALTQAANGLRDGLSVGVHIDQAYYDEDDVLHVVAARVHEVSLVTIPAFENAGVTSVAAAHQRGNTSMTRAQLEAALAAGTITQAEFDRQIALIDAQAGTATTAATTTEVTAAQAAEHPPVEDLSAERQAASPTNGVTATREREVDLRSIAAQLSDHVRAAGGNLHAGIASLTATLTQTTPDDDTGKAFLGLRKWMGEVWRVGAIRRPFISTFGIERLDADGLEGWAWGTTPTVPQDPNDGTAIHSEELTWTPVNVDPQGFAGGWSLQRKFIDLGRSGIIAKTFAKAGDDALLQTEAYVRAKVVSSATNVATAKADVLTLLTDLGILALGGTGTTAFNLDFVHLAPALYGEFINLAEEDVPWWLKNQGEISLGDQSGTAGGISFVSDPNLATRQWVVGDKNAVTYAEFPDVQLTADNIAAGMVDLGVFKYAAALVNDARGLYKGTVTAP
ncbi:MAG TPA: HK97 family phage prohead protease [Galbitalea sp.]|jgi:hypothetical protein